MNCVKCGKKTEGKDVFCPECLETMQRYPVNPGTKVHIPARPEPAERKQTKSRKEKSSEEQIAALQRRVRWLMMVIVGLIVALAVTVGMLVYQMNEPADEQPPQSRSRNYTTSATEDGT